MPHRPRGRVNAIAFSARRSSGAAEETRTLDIQLGKLTLYQLSYSRAFANTPCLSGSNTRKCRARRNVAASTPFARGRTAILGSPGEFDREQVLGEILSPTHGR